jgi:hypothetical protein
MSAAELPGHAVGVEGNPTGDVEETPAHLRLDARFDVALTLKKALHREPSIGGRRTTSTTSMRSDRRFLMAMATSWSRAKRWRRASSRRL